MMHESVDLESRQGASPAKVLLIGCLTFVVIGIIGLGVGAWWVGSHWRGWASDGLTAVMTDAVADFDLSEAERAAIIRRVELIGDEFEAERLTIEDMQKIGQAFLESPIVPVAAVEGIQIAYITPSGLTDGEKAEAKRLNERLARGLFEDRVSGDELAEAIQPLRAPGSSEAVTITRRDGKVTNFQLNIKDAEAITPEELRAYMANVESLLAQKAIPDEPFDIDFVAEFDRAVESAIGRRIAPEGAGVPGMPAMDEMQDMDSMDEMDPMPAMPGMPDMNDTPPASPGGG